METSIYNQLKNKVDEMNKINDEINLIEWNKDDGPKFSSVKEMKEFENRVVNGGLDYLFNESENIEETEITNPMINTFNYTLNNFIFSIYTYEKNNKYYTYLSIKNVDENNSIYDMCGKISSDKNIALSYFDELKQNIINNSIEVIFNNLLTTIDNTLKELKIKHAELTNES